MKKKSKIKPNTEKTQEEIEKLKKKLAKQKSALENILKKLQSKNNSITKIKIMSRKLIFIVLSFLPFLISGQNLMPELLSSSGGLHTGTNTSLSWTLGEININTITSNDFMLTQGFQQTRLYTTSVFEPESLIKAIVYPNPAKDFITIDIDYPLSAYLTLSLIDMNGNTYKHIYLPKDKKTDISDLKSGYYFIAINSGKGIKLTGIKFLKLK